MLNECGEYMSSCPAFIAVYASAKKWSHTFLESRMVVCQEVKLYDPTTNMANQSGMDLQEPKIPDRPTMVANDGLHRWTLKKCPQGHGCQI